MENCSFRLGKRNIRFVCGYGIKSWKVDNGGAELCLFATKGKPKRTCNNVRQVLYETRTKHSKKPEEVRKRIVKLMGELPRIELFARQKTEGWDVWGNEVKS